MNLTIKAAFATTYGAFAAAVLQPNLSDDNHAIAGLILGLACLMFVANIVAAWRNPRDTWRMLIQLTAAGLAAYTIGAAAFVLFAPDPSQGPPYSLLLLGWMCIAGTKRLMLATVRVTRTEGQLREELVAAEVSAARYQQLWEMQTAVIRQLNKDIASADEKEQSYHRAIDALRAEIAIGDRGGVAE